MDRDAIIGDDKMVRAFKELDSAKDKLDRISVREDQIERELNALVSSAENEGIDENSVEEWQKIRDNAVHIIDGLNHHINDMTKVRDHLRNVGDMAERVQKTLN